jgi:uncharacterized RDD family membrane protein YckC
MRTPRRPPRRTPTVETPPPAPDEGGQGPLPPPSLSPAPQGTQPPPAPPADPSTLYGAAPPPPPYPPAPPYGGYSAPVYAMPAPTDGPAPGLRYAGFGIRTAAYLIDAILVGIVALIVSPALGGVTKQTNTVIGDTLVTSTTINGAVYLFAILLGAIYFVGFWSLNSRTPGMMAFHLRVLRAVDGRPVGIGAAVVRYIGLLISFWVIFLGVIWVAIDPRRQGWHDKMAGTFVVQEVSPRA